jgi:hypothetical protein
VTALVTYGLIYRPLLVRESEMTAIRSSAEDREHQIRMLSKQLHFAQNEIEVLQSPYQQLFSFIPFASSASGHFFWDKKRQEAHVYLLNLGQPEPGHRYVLWLKGQPEQLRSWPLDVDSNGDAALLLELGIVNWREAVVSEESSLRDLTSPSSRVLLRSSLSS